MQFQGAFNTGFPYPGQNSQPNRPTRVQITNPERGVYNSLLAQADSESSGKIEGRQAVEFFKKSGLPVEVLKKVWELATPNGESFLDRDRFYISMRLIALGQEGVPLNPDTMHTVPKDYPKFTSGSISTSWTVPDEDKFKYGMIFDNTSNGKGYLTGMEAKEIFQRTELTLPDLKQVWDLVDTDKSGKLNKNQFVVAMHVINRKVNGRTPVPDRLPGELKMLIDAGGDVQGFDNVGPTGFLQQSSNLQPVKPKDPLFEFGDVKAVPVIKTNFQPPADSMLNLAPSPVVKNLQPDGLLDMGFTQPVKNMQNLQTGSIMGMSQPIATKTVQPAVQMPSLHSYGMVDDWEAKDLSLDMSRISLKSDKSVPKDAIPKEKFTSSIPVQPEFRQDNEEIEEYKYKLLEQSILDKQQMLKDKENMLKFYKTVYDEDKIERESLEKLNKDLEARVKEMEKAVSKMLEIYEKTQKLAKKGSFNASAESHIEAEQINRRANTLDTAHHAEVSHSHLMSRATSEISPGHMQHPQTIEFGVQPAKVAVKQAVIQPQEIKTKPVAPVTPVPQFNSSNAPQTASTDFEFPKSFGYGSGRKEDLPDLSVPKSAGIEKSKEIDEKTSSVSSPGMSMGGFDFAKAPQNSNAGFDYGKAGQMHSASSSFDFGAKQATQPPVQSSFDFGGKQSAQPSMQASFDFNAAKPAQPSQPPMQASFDFNAAKPAQPSQPPMQASFDFNAAKPAQPSQPPMQASFDFNSAKPVQPPMQASFDFNASKSVQPSQPPMQASFDFNAAKPIQPPQSTQPPMQASFDFNAAKPIQPPQSTQPPMQASFDFNAAKPIQPPLPPQVPIKSSFGFDSDKSASKDPKESFDFNMDKESFGFNFTQSKASFANNFADFDQSAFSTTPVNMGSFQEGVFSLDPSKITQKPSTKAAFDFS